MEDREPTEQELEFLDPLLGEFPDLQDWFHRDRDGTPWLMVSYDFVSDAGITATLRLDYDGQTLEGGWSPAYLNWDAGVRAREVPIDTTGPDGLASRPGSASEAVQYARAWLAERIAEGPAQANASADH